MKANKLKTIYVLEVLENSTLDNKNCVVCVETKRELIKQLKKEIK